MFTIQQIQEIARKLQAMGKKDSQFKELTSFSGDEMLALVSNLENYKASIGVLTNYIKDRVDVEVNYELIDSAIATLSQQIKEGLDDKIDTISSDVKALSLKADQINNSLLTQSTKLNTVTDLLSGIDSSLDTLINKSNEEVTLTVTSPNQGAVILIDNEVKTSTTVLKGTLVGVKVSAEGHTTFFNIFNVNKTQSISVPLSKQSSEVEDTAIFKIVTRPSDAIVTINGVTTDSLVVDKGTEVTWSVEKEGYISQNGSETINEDTTKNINLESIKYTLTLSVVPSDSVVRINNLFTNTITVDAGTEVSISVAKVGYITHTENYTVNKSETKTITLEAEYIDIEPSEIQAEPETDTYEVLVTSNTTWNIE